MNYKEDNDLWFDMILNPDKYQNEIELNLPSLIPELNQRRYTGKVGEDNLKQAFNFYEYVCETCKIAEMEEPKIFDFGAGWGRIIRFFLRNTSSKNLYAIDVMKEAISLMKSTHFDGNIQKCNPLPPIENFKANEFNIIYAFSVFSHLKEDYFIEWMKYFRKIISKDGYIVFTSRGIPFLNYIKSLKANNPKNDWPNYLEKMGDLEEVSARYDNGDYIFFPSFGGDELSDEYFGEAYISRKYLEKMAPTLGYELISETYMVKNISQHIFVLKPN